MTTHRRDVILDLIADADANSGRTDLWSQADLETLRQWYGQRGSGRVMLDELAVSLGRLKSNICRKARQLGLTDVHRKWGRTTRAKHATDSDRRRAIGDSTRRHIAANGHPRGMLGKKHTVSTLEKVSMASKKRHQTLNATDYDRMAVKSNATKIARYGTAGPAAFIAQHPHSRTNGGRRSDVGDMYFRSSWEANYARYLNWLVSQKRIRSWKYEARTFRFDGITRGTLTYTPDFEVVENNGVVKYHEVKGWMDKTSKTRLKRMTKYHPTVVIVLIDQKQYTAISKVVSGFIPHWEFKGRK